MLTNARCSPFPASGCFRRNDSLLFQSMRHHFEKRFLTKKLWEKTAEGIKCMYVLNGITVGKFVQVRANLDELIILLLLHMSLHNVLWCILKN